MKKLMIMLMACVCSIGLFADEITCRVYGSQSNNVVTVKTPVVTAGGTGEILVGIAQTVKEETTVVVSVYDANNNVVRTRTVTLKASKHSDDFTIDLGVINKNKTFFVKIASASCQM